MNAIQTSKTLALVVALGLAACPALAEEPSPAERAFEHFKQLEGEWRGTNPKGEPVEVRYELTGDGTSVVEHFTMNGEHGMLTVYHLDGETMMLTHYCSTGNQPRMRATDFSDVGTVSFDFVDVTNIASANDGHMHRAVVEFLSEDRVKSAWTFYKNGEAAFTEETEITRVAAN